MRNPGVTADLRSAHAVRVNVAEDAIRAAAQRLEAAASTGEPCAPVRDLLGSSDIGAAYRVQQLLTERRVAAGTSVVGRKIGLTAPAVQQQLGVDQPDSGVLFTDMHSVDGDVAPMGRLLQPKAEAEIAFVLGADLDSESLDLEQVRAAIDYAVAALEIVDSRILDWDITITDTVADNASSGMYVLGSRPVKLQDFEPADVRMELAKNGSIVSTGTGSACLGDPLNAVLWLARAAQRYGSSLRSGDVVLSGALGPMIPVSTGAHIVASISTLGQVTAKFS